jgi:hypothetical protein
MTPVRLHPWPWKTAAVIFMVSLLVLGRQLGFNGYVHPDEPNKVHQITRNDYNFNHPLLMLHSVKWYAQMAGIAGDYNRVILAGRWSSALFSSLAAALLVLVAGRLHGALVAAAAGVFVLTTPLFFELAHYFKEDPSLVFGLALSLVAIQIYSENPGFARAAFLGAACGVAVSGKYAGLIILPFGVYAVLQARRGRDLAALAAFALAAFALINLPMLAVPEVWKSRVDLEMSRLQAEGVPNPRPVPHLVYFSVFGKNASPVILGLIALYLFNVWRRKFRLSPAEWTLLALPVIYLAVLSFIPISSERYILPASVLGACVAAFGLAPLAGMRRGTWLAGLLIAGSVAWQAPRLYAEEMAFASRRHDEVLGFFRTNLPGTAVVLVDNFQTLTPPDFASPVVKQRILGPRETLESLRRDGFTHVLVTPKRHTLFAPDSRRASGLSPEEDAKMRALYAEMFSKCPLVFQWPKGRNTQLEPEFRLYAIPGAAVPAGSGP